MIDCISGGRLIAGFPIGTPMDTCFAFGQNPSMLRERGSNPVCSCGESANHRFLSGAAGREPRLSRRCARLGGPLSARGYFCSMHYRNKWYADLGEAPLLFGLGIHGQYLFVDRRNQLVIVMMSSQANPLDAELISLTMTAVSHYR